MAGFKVGYSKMNNTDKFHFLLQAPRQPLKKLKTVIDRLEQTPFVKSKKNKSKKDWQISFLGLVSPTTKMFHNENFLMRGLTNSVEILFSWL